MERRPKSALRILHLRAARPFSDFGIRSSFRIRHLELGFRLLLLVAILLLTAAQPTFAQPKSGLRAPPLLSPEEGRKAASELLNDLLSRKPDKNSTNTGELRIRKGDRTEIRIPVRFEIFSTSTNWVSRYESEGQASNGMKLTVVHFDGRPNDYWLVQPYASRSATNPPARKLSATELTIPFAGSDFWVGDLGLEFLYWPEQKVLKREMRRSMPCAVLESINPTPAPNGYARVISWIDPDSGGIVHADAYDSAGDLVKAFDPTELGKVNGIRELEEMEMRNRRTRSHTWIKFHLE